MERWPGTPRGWDLARVDVASSAMAGAGSIGAAPAPADAPAPLRARSEELRILRPSNLAEFLLTGLDGADRITLHASRAEQETLHWYLDDRYLGASSSARPLSIDLIPGRHRLACMAEDGEVDSIEFSVISPNENPRGAKAPQVEMRGNRQ